MPLQLVEFQKTPTEEDKDHSTIHILTENLDQVLALCGDRPLCIICICGPSRQGKSFILGHMIRCFDATEKNVDEWMGYDDMKKALDKGFIWQNAYGPVTKGIWIWERPFILKSAEGKECAVLLIDTQGTYDEFTTNRDMTAIVGLSLLMSSVMIFNFFTNLQEDILSSLGTYIEYGLLALDENDKDSGKPFQKLKFLIRDWNNPTEFPYGKKGGEAFIKKKLELKDNQPESAQKVRKTVEKCFQELSCFLMPAIGDKALAKDYDGNIAALNNNFRSKMEEFISDLVGRELITKRIVGNEITAKELRTYMDMYVDTFNSSDIPSAMSMWEATTLVANNNTVEKAQKIYQEEMRRHRRGKKYLNPEAFENARKGAEETALGFFTSAKKYGDKVESFHEALVEFIGKELTVNEADNQTRRMTHLKNTEEDAKEAFKDGFVEIFRFENDEEFWEEECIEKDANRSKSMVLEEFRDALVEETEKGIEEKAADLERLFDDMVNKVKMQNQLNQRKAEESIGLLVDDGLDKYKDEMKGILEDGKFETVDALQERSEQEMKDVLEEFDGKRKPGEREFQQKFRGKLMEAMGKEWGNIETKFELKLMEMVEQANKSVQSLVNDYKKFLEQATKESMMTPDTEEDLKVGHEEVLNESRDTFDVECPFGENSDQRANLLEKLKNELDYELEQALSKVVEYKRKRDEKLREEGRKAGEWYRKEMRGILENNEYLTEEELSKEHDRVKEEAIAKLKDSCGEDVEIKDDFIEKLDEDIEEMFDEFKKSNKKQEEMAFSQTKAKVQESLEKYKQIMTKVVEELNFVGGTAAGSIEEDHERARKEAEESILGKCGKLDDEKKDEILETLRCQIDKAYEEKKKAVKLKELEMKSAVRDVLDKARKYYHGEMQKNIDKVEYMEPDKLVQLHGRLLGLAVSQYGGDLEEQHKAQLKVGLDQSFLKYKEENDMKFNSEAKEIAIGIDLGTTYCCVAAYYKGEVKVVLNSIGKNLTPSYIAFGEDGTSETIGELAKIASFKDPENTIYDAKRMIGRKWEDEKLQNDIKFWPFTVVNDGGVPKIKARGKTFYPEQISAKLLKSLKNEAEKQLQKDIKKVVITVPAYFTDGQRQATVDAGEIAGFEVLEILNEPTAAAIAYKIQKINDDARKVLIYDLGGGTFDVAVLEMEHNEIKVLAVDGDTHLGGEDFDKSMMEYCAQQFKKDKRVDLFEGKDDTNKVVRDKARQAIRRLHIYSEDRKKDLASNSKTKVEIDNLKNGEDICVQVTRDKFEEINKGFFEKTLQIVDKALASAKLEKRDIDDIVLVGGSTRIPKVQTMLKKHFGGKTLNHAIHPDEAVAYGAAVRAAMLNGAEASSSVDFGSTRIHDVTPMSLGIELHGGGFSTIVKKGSKVPSTHKEDNYTTVSDNQTSVDIVIFQGEDAIARNNELLGKFRLSGIPPAARGMEKVRVQMEIDRMGILKVTATSVGSGSEERLVIKADKNRLSDEEKRRLMDEESAGASTSTGSRHSSHDDSDEKADDEDDTTDKEEDDDDYGSWKY